MPPRTPNPAKLRKEHLLGHGITKLGREKPMSAALAKARSNAGRQTFNDNSRRRWELWMQERPSFAHPLIKQAIGCGSKRSSCQICPACDRVLNILKARRVFPCYRAAGYANRHDPGFNARTPTMRAELHAIYERCRAEIATEQREKTRL